MDLIFCLEWINFWVKLDRICFFIIYFNLIILLFIITDTNNFYIVSGGS